MDVDGSVAYERLRISNSSVILEDSTGSTHEYAYASGGYKPPVNEDGTLSKNADNTYTFIDTDGRTYIFDAEGKLTSLTSPTDDRQPAALKYTYAGDPSRLVKIEDGVTSTRYATVYYKGINDTGSICDPNSAPNAPGTFFGLGSQFDQAPNGMLCAFKTSDGDMTNFYYKDGNLVRTVQPGSQITDYAYDAFGRITKVRDSLAADAVGAGIRIDDDSVTTQLAYDSTGRVTEITAPGAATGAARLKHTLDYKMSDQVPLSRFISLSNWDHRAFAGPSLAGHKFEVTHGYLAKNPNEGKIALYSCLVGGWDEMVSTDVNCEGQVSLGMLGYIYKPLGTPPAGSVGIYRCRVGSEHFTSSTSNCEGQIYEFLVGYIDSTRDFTGATEMHITGASDPNGFSKRIQYDSLLRTTKETDLTGKSTSTEWDPVKDLQLSSTDATGLKSTTIYDRLDRAIDTYGPAPAAWYGADRKPLAANMNQVPHVSTGYDEGAQGLAVTMFNNSKLTGAPKLYTTGYTQPSGEIYYEHNLTNTTVTPTDGLSMRVTGKIRLDQVGSYTFRAFNSGGVRLYVDNQLVINNWVDGPERFSPEGAYSNTEAGKLVSITIEANKLGASGSGVGGRSLAVLHLKMPGQPTYTTTGLQPLVTPAYNLTTSATAYDSQLGNVMSTTQYANPAYGTVGSTTLDPTGLNYQSQATYEAPGTGFLRQTSKTLPGGAQTTYQHYGASDTADNPCTPEVEAYHQAGRPKGKLEPDPDGAGPLLGRSSEAIYDESGDVVATRYNTDSWTCTSYDTRGRVTTTVVPGRTENGQTIAGRTITNNYAAGGNPLITSTSDDSGTITVEYDLLGRTTKYTDAYGKVTTNTYDDFGKLTSRASPIGNETYEYDSYDRPMKQKLDGVTFATITYDQYSRIQSVQYPDGISLEPAVRDSLGRVGKVTYKVGDQYVTDEILHSTSGAILSGTENGIAKSYIYDKASRLTSATIGSDTFTYEFGTQDTSCSVLVGYSAGKDSNRTKVTRNGQTTTYCYDSADRLTTSSDAHFKDVAYDSHGNTLSMGDTGHQTAFTYDASDRNTGIVENASKSITYTRDAQDRIISRHSKDGTTVVSNEKHVYTGSSSSPSVILDQNGAVLYKYLSLPGGVSLKINPTSTSAGAKTYSLSNFHGDTMATVNADGAVTGTYMTGPFGEALANTAIPRNATTDTSYNYVGKHQKITETSFATSFIQMGARVYVPELGRFLQVDPVEGGTLNNYVYAMDPVNQADISGLSVFTTIVKLTFQKIIIPATRATYNFVKSGVTKIASKVFARDAVRYDAAKPILTKPKVSAESVSPQVSTRLGQIKSRVADQPGFRLSHEYQNYRTATGEQLPIFGKYKTYDVYEKSNFNKLNPNKGRIVHDEVSGRSWYTEHYDDGFLEIF